MRNLKFTTKEDCIWNKKNICLFEICPSNAKCDWWTLEYDKDKISDRIDQELMILRNLYFTSFNRKRAKIQDKAYGIVKMLEILQKDFGIKNPLASNTGMFLIKKFVGGKL